MATSKDLTDALAALTESANASKPDPMPTRGALPAAKSAAVLGGSAPKTGGGIASPLVELSYASRQYHADKNLTSTDGMVTLVWSPLYQINLVDANNNAVVVRLDMPPT